MARSRRNGRPLVLFALLVLAALAGGGWYLLHKRGAVPAVTTSAPPRTPATPVATAPAERIDPAQDGKPVSVSGRLRVTRPARDPQMGIVAADAVALERQVEMRQWQETCTGKRCEYALAWSAKPIDSSAFRERSGHENPARFPFTSERFPAGELRIGAYAVDPALAAAGVEPVAFPVRAAQLPPNLAATFRDQGGYLYAGTDPAHPAAGDLRVAFRIVPAGERSLSGVQNGMHLKPSAAR